MPRGPERILDEYLVASAKAGSRSALADLITRWTPRLLRFAARRVGRADMAHDIVQETWSSALRTLPRLSDPARFPSWIYAVATRKCVDAIRKMARRRKNQEALKLDPTECKLDPDPACLAADRIDLSSALRSLSPAQRIVVDLFYLDELGVEEIAAAIRTPVGTVKSRLHQARHVLKLHLDGDGHEPN